MDCRSRRCDALSIYNQKTRANWTRVFVFPFGNYSLSSRLMSPFSKDILVTVKLKPFR